MYKLGQDFFHTSALPHIVREQLGQMCLWSELQVKNDQFFLYIQN